MLFKMKLATMRKEQEFSGFFSDGADGSRCVVIQSDKQIGSFDAETGEGMFNMKGCYFIHLSPLLGAKPLKLTPNELAFIKEMCLKPGQSMGAGCIFGGARH